MDHGNCWCSVLLNSGAEKRGFFLYFYGIQTCNHGITKKELSEQPLLFLKLLRKLGTLLSFSKNGDVVIQWFVINVAQENEHCYCNHDCVHCNMNRCRKGYRCGPCDIRVPTRWWLGALLLRLPRLHLLKIAWCAAPCA